MIPKQLVAKKAWHSIGHPPEIEQWESMMHVHAWQFLPKQVVDKNDFIQTT